MLGNHIRWSIVMEGYAAKIELERQDGIYTREEMRELINELTDLMSRVKGVEPGGDKRLPTRVE